MRRKSRSVWILVFLSIVVIFMIYLNTKVAPVVQELAKASVANKASCIINDAIEKQMDDGQIDYDRMIFLEKDINGNITAIKTNIGEINRLKAQTLSVVDKMLWDLDISQIGVPIGNLILPEVLSGIGPMIPVRIVSVSTSDADFRNVFVEAGINQTVHQIMLDIAIVMAVLTPVGAQRVDASSSVVVAETVIVGHVPNSYVDLH